MDTKHTFKTGSGSEATYHSLPALKELGIADVSRLPVSIRIVLESLLRNLDDRKVTESDIKNLANGVVSGVGDGVGDDPSPASRRITGRTPIGVGNVDATLIPG